MIAKFGRRRKKAPRVLITALEDAGSCPADDVLPHGDDDVTRCDVTVARDTDDDVSMVDNARWLLALQTEVLWHLDVFRRSFRDLTGHACLGHSCIFCALKMLFTQFQYSSQSALPPDALRKALAETFHDQQRFQLGLMDDAAECFENLLYRIHFHIAHGEQEEACVARHCVPHRKFAMRVSEQCVCAACGARSEPLPFTQMVHYVSAAALASQSRMMEAEGDIDTPERFGRLLRRAGAIGDMRNCPNNCGERNRIHRNLMNCPDLVSIGLAWDSDRPKPYRVQEVVNSIGTSICLPDMFTAMADERWARAPSLYLTGVVTYYGKHYSTFFYHSARGIWIYFDDARVREIGTWDKVVEKCCRGNYQPLLLLYANPKGTPVSVETAPKVTTMVAGARPFSPVRENGHPDPGGDPGHNRRRAVTPNPACAGEETAAVVTVKPRRTTTPNPGSAAADDDIDYGSDYGSDGNKYCAPGDPQQEDATRPLYSYPGAPWNPRPSADEFQYTLSGTGHYRNGRAVEVVAAATTRPLAPLPTEGQRSEGFRGARVPADVVRYSIHAPPAGGAAPAVNGALNQSYDSAGVHVPRCHGNEQAPPPDGQHESGCSTLPRKGAPAYAAGYRDDDDADGGDLYIDRKAVESILSRQRKLRPAAIASHQVAPGSRSSNSSIESFAEQAIRRRYQGELRVDIPDAVVAATKRDSGYRSGDRNSTGSTSSSTESPPGTDLPLPPGTGHAHSMTALMQWYVQRSSGPVEPRRLAEAAPPGGAGAPVRAIHYNFVDSRLHGSAESFASLSSGGGGGGAPRCRAEDANSLTSLESVSSSSCGTPPPGGATVRLQRVQERQEVWAEEAGGGRGRGGGGGGGPEHHVTDFSTPDPVTKAVIWNRCQDACESLCSEADSLMEQSRIRESYGDTKTALALAMAAIGCTQQAMEAETAAADMAAHARSKHAVISKHLRSLQQRISIQQPSSRPDSKGLLQVAAAAATAAAAAAAADATQPASQPTHSPPQVAPVQPAATFTTFQAPVSTATVRPAQLPPGRHDDAAGHSRQSSIQSNSSSSSTITSGGVASVAPPRGGGARRPTTGELARALKTRERAKHRSLPSADYGGATNQSLPDLRVAAAADGRSLTAGGAAALPHSLSAGSLRDLSDTVADVRLSPQQGIVGPRSASVRDVEPTATGTPPGGDGESLASRINSIDVDATDAYGGSPEGTYSVRYGTTVREGEGAAAAAEEDGGATSREAEKQLQLLFTSRLREREMLARQRAEMSRCKMAPPSHAHRDAGDTCCASSEPCAMNGRDDASKQERVFRDDADADEDEPRVNVREMAAIFERSKQANICGRGAAAERLEATDAAVKRVANCTLPRQRDKPTPPSSSSSARRVTFSDQVALCSDSDADSVTSAPAAAGARPKPALKTSRRLVGGAGGGGGGGGGGAHPTPVAEEGIRTLPCHLCRSKEIVAPAMYCSDCDFYMSRFKPKP